MHGLLIASVLALLMGADVRQLKRDLSAVSAAEHLPREQRRSVLDGCWQRLLALHQAQGTGGGEKLGMEALEAFELYFQARLSLDGDDANLWMGLGSLKVDLGKHGEAREAFLRAAEAPGAPARARLLSSVSARRVCDWRTHTEDMAELRRILDAELADPLATPSVHPFDALWLPLSAATTNAITRRFNARAEGAVAGMASPLAALPTVGKGKKRLKVAYVSSLFSGTHPMTQLTKGLFRCHDRSKVETLLYATNPRPTGGEALEGYLDLQRTADVFVDAAALTAGGLAARLAGDGVDVAVNLNGWSGACFSEAMCLRCAPLQVAYMGFPSSMGATSWTDYSLVDDVVAPPEKDRNAEEERKERSERRASAFEEPLVRLGGGFSYFVNDHRHSAREVLRLARGSPGALEERDSLRRSSGLPGASEGFVFCCFNQMHKLDPTTFSAWLRILRATAAQKAVLWLLCTSDEARQNILDFAAAEAPDVDPSRIVFADFVPREQHLLRIALADAFLDTLEYNAHTLGCDALWAGVPLVTCPGERMASRVALSLLRASGLEQDHPLRRIRSLADYEAAAVALARDPAAYDALRRRLESLRHTSRLFDTEAWTRQWEAALEKMWERRRLGLPPADVTV